MDKKYRMAEWFSSQLEEDDLLYFCEDERKVVVYAVNAHDAMQDRIAELEKLNDELHTLVNQGAGLVLSFSNDAVFIDGLGSLPIGTADTASKQAQRIVDLEQDRDQLKAQNAELVDEMNAVKTDLENGFTICSNCSSQEDTKDLDAVWMLNETLNKSPVACLSEIRAQAIESVKAIWAKELNNDESYFGFEIIDSLGHEISKLRQQSTDISTQVVDGPEQQGTSFEKVTGAGQIELGDNLVLRTRDGIITAAAKQIIQPGVTDESGGEEIVYNRKKNHYFITSMLVSGQSWVKEVYIVRAPQ